MKQNSSKNMILSHFLDIKAKFEQKSINNIKLPFEGPFKDKHTSRSHLMSVLRQPYICLGFLGIFNEASTFFYEDHNS